MLLIVSIEKKNFRLNVFCTATPKGQYSSGRSVSHRKYIHDAMVLSDGVSTRTYTSLLVV